MTILSKNASFATGAHSLTGTETDSVGAKTAHATGRYSDGVTWQEAMREGKNLSDLYKLDPSAAHDRPSKMSSESAFTVGSMMEFDVDDPILSYEYVDRQFKVSKAGTTARPSKMDLRTKRKMEKAVRLSWDATSNRKSPGRITPRLMPTIGAFDLDDDPDDSRRKARRSAIFLPRFRSEPRMRAQERRSRSSSFAFLSLPRTSSMPSFKRVASWFGGRKKRSDPTHIFSRGCDDE